MPNDCPADPLRRYVAGEPLRIGNQWQLLMDDTVVEDRFRLTRRLCRLAKHAANPVVMRDRPWEGDGVGRPLVIWDPEWRKYRMWYRGVTRAHPEFSRGYATFLCHAVSDDGITWDKQPLDLEKAPDGSRTNIVYRGTYHPRADCSQVWRDENEPDPGRRYRMIALERRAGMDGLHLLYSGDGLRWRLDEHAPSIFDYHSDCENHVVPDPGGGSWLLYCRPILMNAGSPAGGRRADLPPEITGLDKAARRHAGRRVSVAVSQDMRHWSFPRTVLYPDERDLPDIDHCLVIPAGAGLVMLASVMRGDTDGRFEIRLASSPDGLRWHRFHGRKPFIARGPQGAWDGGRICCGSVVRRDDMLWIYYAGNNLGQHETGAMQGGIGVAMTKVGRWVEQRAGDMPGFLLTREFVLEGDRLLVNTTGKAARGRQPALRVEILRRPPITGKAAAETMLQPARMVARDYSLADCDPISQDGTELEVKWKGNPDLSALRGQPVCLRFQLRNKGLCAFRIAQD